MTIKHLIAAAAIATAPAAGMAGDDLAGKNLLCGALGELAKSIMTVRQTSEVPQSQMRKTVVSNYSEADPIFIRDMTIALVDFAYEYPKFTTPDVQRQVIVRFQQEAESICFKKVEEMMQ